MDPALFVFTSVSSSLVIIYIFISNIWYILHCIVSMPYMEQIIYIYIHIYIDTHISLYNIYIYILLRTHAGDGTFEPAFASHLLGSLGRGASSCKELQEAAAAVVVESGGSCSGLVIFQQHVFLYFATSNLLVFWGVYQSNIGPKYTPYVKPTSFKFSCAIAQKKTSG